MFYFSFGLTSASSLQNARAPRVFTLRPRPLQNAPRMYKGLPATAACLALPTLDLAGEVSFGSLSVPLFDPPVRADVGEDTLKVLAHVRALALDLLAPVEVQVALEAVLGLVLVREARIPGGGLDADLGQRCNVLGHPLAGFWGIKTVGG